jgi:hypothetical protein
VICYKFDVVVDSRKDGFMMMKRLMLILGSVALLAVFSFAADEPSQSGCRMMGGGGMMGGMHGMMGGGRGMMGGMGGNFDFSKTVSLVGQVYSVAMAQGQGFPHFVLVVGGTKVTVIAAPFRAVLDANYKIAAGDQMSVVAFPSAQPDLFMASVLTNGNAVLNLRDASGVPVAGRGCAGRGDGTCGNCPNR